MELAPIALFAYKRPEHTLKSLTALSECALAQESILYIFCDGPKREEDRANVEKVREVVASRKWCANVHIVTREDNWGLAKSIINGVSQLCDDYDKVIVLEDDMIVAKGFIDYMNRALELYSDCPQVLQVSGHRFPFIRNNDTNEAFFMPVSTCLGWATWKSAWGLFDPRADGYEELAANKALRERFDLGGFYPYSQMLFDQVSGKLDSWAIRWWWSFFKNNGLCLYPGESLVKNIGFGEGATHPIEGENYHNDPQWTQERTVTLLPDQIMADEEAFVCHKKYLKPHIPNESVIRGRLKRVAKLLGLRRD